MKHKIIVVCGATGIGKTSTAINLAQYINGEIISADSMQIYKYMDIGSAKPTREERKLVTHHLVDFVDPADSFDAAEFVTCAGQVIETLSENGKVPVIAGGTGFYVKALLHGLFRDRPVNQTIISELTELGTEKGSVFLHRELSRVDPASSGRIHENDMFRIIRALEVYRSTGKTITAYHQEHGFKEERYHSLKIGLSMDREKLYERINLRVDMMLEQGFIQEVQNLLDMGYQDHLKPMQSIGYKHITDYLLKRSTLEESVRLMKRDTRRYAKRQMTWFRNDHDIQWFEAGDAEGIISYADDFLN